MATILEELAIRLGIDQSQVGPNLQQFRDKVNSANNDAKKSFINAGSEARSFKTVLKELTAESPLLGLAFRAAINPVIAIMSGAVMAFKYFNEKLKETNERLDAIGKSNAASNITRIQDAIHASDMASTKRSGMIVRGTAHERQAELTKGIIEDNRKELEFRREELNKLEAKYPKAFDPGKTGILRNAAADYESRAGQRKQIEEARALLASAQARYTTAQEKELKGAAEEGAIKNAIDAEKFLEKAAKDVAEAMKEQEREAEQQDKQFREQLASETKVKDKLAEAADIEAASKRESMTLEQQLIDLTGERLSLQRQIALEEDDQIRLAEKTVDLAKKDQEIAKVKEEIGKRTAQQQKEQAEYSASRNRIEANREDSFKLDVDKLKTHGQWVYDRKRRRSYWVASAAAQQAQRIDWLENESFNQRAWGHIGTAEGMLKEAGTLRGELVAAKILKPDPADVLLSALDSKKAFKVSVQNLD